MRDKIYIVKQDPNQAPGRVYAIKLADGSYTYFRHYENACGFYKLNTKELETDVEVIAQHEIFLFTDAVLDWEKKQKKNGNWIYIGEKKFAESEERYIIFYSTIMGTYSLFDGKGGTSRRATREECIGKWEDRVWRGDVLEDLLLKYFQGKDDPKLVQFEPLK
jgi:hypothetical protein